MDNLKRLEYNWIPSPDNQIEQAYSMFNLWIDENPDQYTVQVSYPRSGRHWLEEILKKLVVGKIMPLRWITAEDNDALYLSVHSMMWPRFDKRLRYVLLLRDPRDVILSAINFRDGLWHKYFWEHQCEWYKDMVDKFLRLNTIIVQYERLCLYPVQEIERILRFADLTLNGSPSIAFAVKQLSLVQFESGGAARIDSDSILYSSVDHDRYKTRCLKWQRDERFLREEYHIMIWAKLKDIMLPFGYTFDGHSTNLLTR